MYVCVHVCVYVCMYVCMYIVLRNNRPRNNCSPRRHSPISSIGGTVDRPFRASAERSIVHFEHRRNVRSSISSIGGTFDRPFRALTDGTVNRRFGALTEQPHRCGALTKGLHRDENVHALRSGLAGADARTKAVVGRRPARIARLRENGCRSSWQSWVVIGMHVQ